MSKPKTTTSETNRVKKSKKQDGCCYSNSHSHKCDRGRTRDRIQHCEYKNGGRFPSPPIMRRKSLSSPMKTAVRALTTRLPVAFKKRFGKNRRMHPHKFTSRNKKQRRYASSPDKYKSATSQNSSSRGTSTHHRGHRSSSPVRYSKTNGMKVSSTITALESTLSPKHGRIFYRSPPRKPSNHTKVSSNFHYHHHHPSSSDDGIQIVPKRSQSLPRALLYRGTKSSRCDSPEQDWKKHNVPPAEEDIPDKYDIEQDDTTYLIDLESSTIDSRDVFTLQSKKQSTSCLVMSISDLKDIYLDLFKCVG